MLATGRLARESDRKRASPLTPPAALLQDAENGLPALAREVLAGLLEQFRDFDMRVTAYDRQIRALAAASEPARRLMQVEAIGPQTATALVASMGDPHVFENGRSYAASIGITPRQHSSGGKERIGRITRQGDGYVDPSGTRNASRPARHRHENGCKERLGATAEGPPTRERGRRRPRRQTWRASPGRYSPMTQTIGLRARSSSRPDVGRNR